MGESGSAADPRPTAHSASGTVSNEELGRLVEVHTSGLTLCCHDKLGGDTDAGRYLVARRTIKTGEVLLSEIPIFHGTPEGNYSRDVYTDEFLKQGSLAEDGFAVGSDAFHPCSPVVDCIANIMLAKHHADANSCSDGVDPKIQDKSNNARYRLRQFNTLCRSAVNQMLPECAGDIYGVLKPEMQRLTSKEELADQLQVLSSNRFGGEDDQMDVMFIGSMFEHSCEPNVFVADAWQLETTSTIAPREYRSSRDIARGEALSIDYLLLPRTYLSAAKRRPFLAGWGFSCVCARCTRKPDLTRAFVCPSCQLHELCPCKPPLPQNDAGIGTCLEELNCRACGKAADAEFSKRCLVAEKAAVSAFSSTVDENLEQAQEELEKSEGLIGRFHYVRFEIAWACWAEGAHLSLDNRIVEQRSLVDYLIESLRRLWGSDVHPQLLQLYHARAMLTPDDINSQRCFLDLECATIRRFFPEEADRQDAEALHMVQRRGPMNAQRKDANSHANDWNWADEGILQENPDATEKLRSWDLSCMD